LFVNSFKKEKPELIKEQTFLEKLLANVIV